MTITWLHVSDFHFRQGESYDREVVLRSLVQSVKRFREDRPDWPKPDVIFATGDVASYGEEAEYSLATSFFDDLVEAAGLDRRRLFVVPGNHDVEWRRARRLKRTLESNEEADDYLGRGESIEHITIAQRNFADWYNAYFDGIRKFPETSSCGPTEALEIRGYNIGILPLNSALFCQGDDDRENLWLGRRALASAIEDLKRLGANLNIALLHHPLGWLNSVERANIKAALNDAVDVVLRGHLHENDVESTVGIGGGALHLAAGASYQTRKWPNRALYVTVDGDNVTVHPINYVDGPREAWAHDTSLFALEPGNVGKFKILKKSASPPDAESTTPKKDNKYWKSVRPDDFSQNRESVFKQSDPSKADAAPSPLNADSREAAGKPSQHEAKQETSEEHIEHTENASRHGTERVSDSASPPFQWKTAVIFTALPLEFRAVRSFLTDVKEILLPNGQVCEEGTFPGRHVNWRVTVVEIGPGNEGAAAEVTAAVIHLKPHLAFFVGVAGGLKDVALGDVVAATKMYAYEYGKDEESFRTRPDLFHSSTRVLNCARAVSRNNRWHDLLASGNDHGEVEGPNSLIAPIAAGNKVVSSKRSRVYRLLREAYGDAVAVEMEGFGFHIAMHSHETVQSLVVRGISDLIDGKENADRSGSQPVAARNAAAFAITVLKEYQPPQSEQVSSAGPGYGSESSADALSTEETAAPRNEAQSGEYEPVSSKERAEVLRHFTTQIKHKLGKSPKAVQSLIDRLELTGDLESQPKNDQLDELVLRLLNLTSERALRVFRDIQKDLQDDEGLPLSDNDGDIIAVLTALAHLVVPALLHDSSNVERVRLGGGGNAPVYVEAVMRTTAELIMAAYDGRAARLRDRRHHMDDPAGQTCLWHHPETGWDENGQGAVTNIETHLYAKFNPEAGDDFLRKFGDFCIDRFYFPSGVTERTGAQKLEMAKDKMISDKLEKDHTYYLVFSPPQYEAEREFTRKTIAAIRKKWPVICLVLSDDPRQESYEKKELDPLWRMLPTIDSRPS